MTDRLRIHMTGSEWFESRPGGLNRYFQDLHSALVPLADMSAAAFGVAPAHGTSWGPVGGSLLQRVLRSSGGVPANVDVVDAHFALYGPRSVRPGTRFVRHFQGPWSSESRVSGHSSPSVGAKHWVEVRAYAHAQAIIVLSSEFKDILVNEYAISGDRVHIIPPGVDLDRFAQKDTDLNSTRVVCVRRLEKRMGIHVLLEAWSSVLRSVPGASLDIVGEGSQRERLEEQIVQLGLSRSVRLHGRVDDSTLSSLYEAATVSVVPTIELEGFGLIALESLATGTPPIVTRCGGLPSAVNGLDSTLIVRPGDAEALASRIVSALAGARPSADKCRSHAEKFSWTSVARRHIELYSSL